MTRAAWFLRNQAALLFYQGILWSMRILHVNKYFRGEDGTGKYMIDLMRLEEASGCTVAALAFEHPQNLASPWDRYFISDDASIGLAFGPSRQVVRKTNDIMAVFSPDIVHLHCLNQPLTTSVLKVCQRLGVPVVITVNELPNNKKLPINSTTNFLVFSDFLLQRLTALGCSAKRITKLFPPTSSFLFNNFKKNTSDRLGVLFADHLEKDRGVKLILEAATWFPETEFMFVGTGSVEREVIEAATLHSNIRYLGQVKDSELFKLMGMVQVMVMPTLKAGPSEFRAFEALFLGTPLLVSDQGALPELISDNTFGRIFRAGDRSDLELQLRKFLNTKRPLTLLNKKAQAWAERQTNPQRHLEQVLNLYRQIHDNLING